MAPAMLLAALLCLFVPHASLGKRASPAGFEASLRHIDAHRGVPMLEVLRTSSPAEAAPFLEQWSSDRDFGLFVQLAPASLGLSVQRVALLGISRGTKVLIYDLRPLLHQPPQPLPPALAEFLGAESRTFFGTGLLRPAALLVKEFGIAIRCIDPKVRGWQEAPVDGGVFRAADRLLGISFPRRPHMRQLDGQAVFAYLQWAVADLCVASFEQPAEEWVLTEEELAEAAKPGHIQLARPKHELTDAEEELLREEAHAEQLLRRRTMRRSYERRGASKLKRERRPEPRERKVQLAARGVAPRTGQ